MYLRSGNWYKSGRALESNTSVNSSEESVSNTYRISEPIVEEENLSDSTSIMASENHSADFQDFSMAFNVRLVYVKANSHDAQLYRDPMNRWVVKIGDHPTALDAAPWVNYQGDSYMGQEGVRYIVVKDPECVDKWGQLVMSIKEEEPPYVDSDELKLLSQVKTQQMLVDNPDIALYVRETNNVKTGYFTKNPNPNTLHEDKVLYVYLQGVQTMKGVDVSAGRAKEQDRVQEKKSTHSRLG